MTDEELVEKVARGLTKAQREAICPNDSGWAPEHKGKGWAKTTPTMARLFNAGLFAECNCLSPLTPLGVKVRDYLRGTDHG